MTDLKWRDMATAPRVGGDSSPVYIAVLPKQELDGPVVVYWNGQSWWLPEGAIFGDDDLVGWSPLPAIP